MNEASDNTTETATSTAVEAKNAGAAPALPFNAEPIMLDPASLSDDLSEVQSRGSAATRISGAHLAGLLYDQGTIATHRAPYGIHYAPNFAGGTREEPGEG